MKRRMQLSLFMVIVIAICLLDGCGSAGETHLPDAGNMNTSAAESANTENSESFSFADISNSEESAGTENNVPFSFIDISNLEFWFGSGAGAWRTILTVYEDGTFEGEYSDSDMGSRVYYLCNFTGKFSEPLKVNDYTYSVKIERIELQVVPGIEEIKDGTTYIYSEPYGLDDAEELLFYLPGAPVEDLPEAYRSWMMGYHQFTDTKLPFFGLYNVNAETGFSSHEKEGTDDGSANIDM